MTAAKEMDVTARLPDCAGQAADAASAYTQVKMEDAQSVLIYGYVFHHTNGQNHGQTLKTPQFLSNEACSDTRLLASCGKDSLRKFYSDWDGKIPNWECLFVHRKQRLFLSVYVDDTKNGWNKQNMGPMWKTLMKLVDLGEPTSFLDDVQLGCTQRECEANETFIDEYRKMFESRISAGATEILPDWEELRAKTVAWSYDMEGRAKKKNVERYCELASKKTEHLHQVSTPCFDDHNFKKEELKAVGELSNVCSQIVFK